MGEGGRMLASCVAFQGLTSSPFSSSSAASTTALHTMSSTRLLGHPSLPAPVVHAGFSAHQSKSHVLAGVQDAYWSDDDAVSHSQTPVRTARNHLSPPDHHRMMPNVPFVSKRWIFQTSILSHVSVDTRYDSFRHLYETRVVTSPPDLPLLLASH
jgi:hypothetical protein